jgi:hypothetical protein
VVVVAEEVVVVVVEEVMVVVVEVAKQKHLKDYYENKIK